MSSYTLSRSPATVSALVGVVMLGCTVGALQAQVETMDKVYDKVGLSTSSSAVYLEHGYSPTFHVNLHDAGAVAASSLLHEASLSFVHGLSSGVESLGTEYASVIEDNFWDLVLR